MIDVGEVKRVEQREQAVFLEVELRHHVGAGFPREALVRWCPPYAGDGFGAWWIPSVGEDVVCAFPGVGPDGAVDDLDEGYAFAVVSSRPEPPQDGLQGALAPDRRVFRGRAGEAQDDHLQGSHDLQVDGAQERVFLAERSTETTGDETRANAGTLSWAIEGVTSLVSQATASIKGVLLLRLLSDSRIEIDAPTVALGLSSAIKRIVTEEFLPLYNGHTHGGSQVPDQQAQVGVHTSTRTRVDG